MELFGNVEFFTFKLITWEIAFSTFGGIYFPSTVNVVFGHPEDLFFIGLPPPDFSTANSHDLHVWLCDSQRAGNVDGLHPALLKLPT